MHAPALCVLALLLGVQLCAQKMLHPYPIEASWFSDKYTHEEWESTIENFESIGGHIIWKRGRIFR